MLHTYIKGNFNADDVNAFKEYSPNDRVSDIIDNRQMDPATLFMTGILTLIQHPNDAEKVYSITNVSIKNIIYTKVMNVDFVGVAYYLIIPDEEQTPVLFRFRHPMHLTKLNKGIKENIHALIDLEIREAATLLSKLSNANILNRTEIGVAGALSDKPLADFILNNYCN